MNWMAGANKRPVPARSILNIFRYFSTDLCNRYMHHSATTPAIQTYASALIQNIHNLKKLKKYFPFSLPLNIACGNVVSQHAKSRYWPSQGGPFFVTQVCHKAERIILVTDTLVVKFHISILLTKDINSSTSTSNSLLISQYGNRKIPLKFVANKLFSPNRCHHQHSNTGLNSVHWTHLRLSVL